MPYKYIYYLFVSTTVPKRLKRLKVQHCLQIWLLVTYTAVHSSSSSSSSSSNVFIYLNDSTEETIETESVALSSNVAASYLYSSSEGSLRLRLRRRDYWLIYLFNVCVWKNSISNRTKARWCCDDLFLNVISFVIPRPCQALRHPGDQIVKNDVCLARRQEGRTEYQKRARVYEGTHPVWLFLPP